MSDIERILKRQENEIKKMNYYAAEKRRPFFRF